MILYAMLSKCSASSADHVDLQIIPLYKDALDILKEIPMTSDTLYALAQFLYSAFVRIPHPGLGPAAFRDFWIHIQPTLAHFAGPYPDAIKTALQACHDVYGLAFLSDISLSTESQTASQAHAHMALVSSHRPRLCLPRWPPTDHPTQTAARRARRASHESIRATAQARIPARSEPS